MGAGVCRHICGRRVSSDRDALDERTPFVPKPPAEVKKLEAATRELSGDAVSTCSHVSEAGPSEAGTSVTAALELADLPFPKVLQFLTVSECFRVGHLSKTFHSDNVIAGKAIVPWLVCTKESPCDPLELVSKVSLENVVAAWFLGIPRAMDALGDALGVGKLEAGSQFMREIVRFSAKGCRVDKTSIPVLKRVFEMGSITLLNLELNQMTDDTAVALVTEVLEGDQYLETLNIRSNRLGDGGAKALSKLVWHPTLRILNLKSNAVGHDGACELAKMLEDTTTLEVLNLRNQTPKLPSSAGVRLAEALKASKTLRRIKLRRNKMDDKVAKAFVEPLTTGAAKNTLVELDLQQNVLTVEGGAALARLLLENKVLEVVYVGGNRFTKEDIVKKLEGVPLDPRMEFEVMPDV